MTARPLKLHLRCALVPTLETPAPGIRPMTRSDIPALGKLFYLAYLGTVDYEGESEQEATSTVTAAFDGEFGPFVPEASMVFDQYGRLLSASFVTRWQGRPLLAFAVTAPGSQGQGLSRRCTGAAMQVLAAAGSRELDLFVTQTNVPALALYRRLGFAPARAD